jgi:hypothetical protein
MKKSIVLSDLAGMNNHQLVNVYNRYVDSEVFPVSLGKLYWHIVDLLKKRGVDCSAITSGKNIHFGEQFRCFLHRSRIYLQADLTETSKIQLQFKTDKTHELLSAKVVFVDDANYSLQGHEGDEALLLILRHDHLQTHIDATGVKGKILLGFNNEGNFASLNILNSVEAGRFAILSQARTALVVPFSAELVQNGKVDYWDFE